LLTIEEPTWKTHSKKFSPRLNGATELSRQMTKPMDDYAERFQQLIGNLIVPLDNIFMLSIFYASLLDYLLVATIGLWCHTFVEVVDFARTTEEGLPKQCRMTSTTTSTRHQKNIKCTSCVSTGHQWPTCFCNPTSTYAKRIEATIVHLIQPQPTNPLVSTDHMRLLKQGTYMQKHLWSIYGSMEHPNHRSSLLLDKDVKTAIKNKL